MKRLIRNAYKMMVGKPEGKTLLEDVGVQERMIWRIKWTLKTVS
jgi:hypothetical protein